MVDRTIEIDLGRSVRVADVPALGVAFLQWWSSELLEALPDRVRKALPQKKPEAIIVLEPDAWRIAPSNADAVDVPLATTDFIAELQRVLPNSSQYRLTALIARNRALIRRVRLPMITDARVRPAVELQLDKLTPFKPENVRFACRVIERRIESNDMEVELAIVPDAAFSEIEANLGAANLKPDIIDVAGPSGLGLGFNLRGEGKSALSGRYRMMNLALGVGAVLAWLMAYYALGAAGEAEIARWQAKITELRPQTQHSADLAQQIQALSQPIEIASARGRTSIIDILNELTDRMPDTAHLFDLRIEGGVIKATGIAEDTPELIGKLDASRLFSEARFVSPVTRRQGTSLDRFDVALKLREAKP